ncbi:hypothetical protein [Arthrobacter zhaoguopingii]|uniref:hypothetical protein n=1 Tax=Arthrobacter zhaoguopingii TaxID=2681491 RepID=UPI00135BD236|nr:hypothetical protein [Arthrobacter zhaoguopingii]
MNKDARAMSLRLPEELIQKIADELGVRNLDRIPRDINIKAGSHPFVTLSIEEVTPQGRQFPSLEVSIIA